MRRTLRPRRGRRSARRRRGPADHGRRRAGHRRGPRPATDRPIVIGHRGASGYRPEHTLEAYRLAIRMGADYVEPDLVSTSDGVLVARHENEISGTTDVGSPGVRGAQGHEDHRRYGGDRLVHRGLHPRRVEDPAGQERLPQVRVANTAFDGRFEVPTLQEVIDLARTEGRARGRTIGIYPETKHPSYFASIGLPLEEPLLRVLRQNKLDRKNSPVFIQSFETANLRRLSRLTEVKLVQLLDASGRPTTSPSPATRAVTRTWSRRPG
ncbi:glycerophosphodiester phosphodiesterase family protein [Micromonospora sp. M12]